MKILKRFLIFLLILSILFAGAMGAYYWYITAHLFVEDAVYPKNSETIDLRGTGVSLWHVQTVQSQLPECKVYWDVPFQDTTCSNDITALTVTSFAVEDIEQLEYFEDLKTVDASSCSDYAALEVLAVARPDLRVIYQVSIGETSVEPDVTTLVLESGQYDLDVLTENLIYLPKLQSVHFPRTELTQEQISALTAVREGISVTSTVEVFGQEMSLDTAELDLSELTSDQVDTVAADLAKLPALTGLELMKADGTSNLTLEDVQKLQEAAPNALVHYEFEYQGFRLSTTTEEVHIKSKKIGDAGVEELRRVLDVMDGCKRFVLEYCSISNEVLAQLREDYRGRTKIVWRVFFGGGSAMTDAEVIRCTYDLVDDNCDDLFYCEDARFVDFGHNEWLDNCGFVAGMKSLEYCILSGAPIRSLEPFANCKNLKFLEVAFCEYIENVEPLRNCTQLEKLNISNTHVTDLTPLDDLPLTHFVAMEINNGRSRVPTDEQERFVAAHPDCWTQFLGKQPYDAGWRREEDRKTSLPHYAAIGIAFRYPDPPNNTGWYLSEEERSEIEALQPMKNDNATGETLPEETVPDETTRETIPEDT